MNRVYLSLYSVLLKTVQVEPAEVRVMFWSFSYFFALLCSYYIIRPIRDEMGIIGGVENLQWLFTGTLLVMTAVVPLFAWVTSRFPRRRFLPYIYVCFILMLLIFYVLMDKQHISVYLARIFFIWVSVFNLFVVSVFWSFMADLYSNAQARRLFGFIAAGGTVGALTGPALTALLVQPLGARNLLLVSALFLSWTIICITRLSVWSDSKTIDKNKPVLIKKESLISGGLWSGIVMVLRSPYLLGICLLMLLYTSLSTFLYFMQAEIIRDAFVGSSQRTAVFALIDLAVNTLTLLIQLFLTSRLIKWFGLAITLAIIPVLLSIGFSLLAVSPVLIVILFVQVIRRAGNYSIMRPAREMLYVVLSREEKYKAKNFIDTVVYRGGDAISAWLFAAFRSMGISFSVIALFTVPLSIVWAWIAFSLGRQQQSIAKAKN